MDRTLAADQVGDRAKREMLRAALQEKLGTQFFSIRQVFDDHVVFETETGKTARRDFSIEEESGTVTLSDQETTGVMVEQFMEITVQKGSKEMDRNQAVDQLIANQETPWADDDRESLLAMSDGSFAKLTDDGEDQTDDATAGAGDETTTEPATNAAAPAAPGDESNVYKVAKGGVIQGTVVGLTGQDPAAAPATTTEETAEPGPITMADYIAAAPAVLQGPLRDMEAVANRERAKLIDALEKHPRCTFTVDVLKAKPTDELRALVQLAVDNVRQADFSGRQPAAASSKATYGCMPVPDAPSFNQAAK